MSWRELDAILSKPGRGETLSTVDAGFLLRLTDKERIEALFATARDLRQKYFGDKIFLYGFIYVSTYCRNECNFCFYRESNPKSGRYRKVETEIVEAARGLAASGIHLIDLTMGEDPAYFSEDAAGFENLVRLVETVRRATGLPVMISPGAVPRHVLKDLAGAGADWFACYQETHDPSLFNRLRPGQDYEARFNLKPAAHELGMLIEEGLLCGVGESPDDVAASISAMRFLDADQVRVMNFVPQPGTPMETVSPPDPLRELLISAVLRLSFPDRLIPASLDVDGLAGLKPRLDAGANVVTSLAPPGWGLAGVAQSSLDIENGKRSAAAVLPVLENLGLRAVSPGDLRAWIERRRGALSA
ncbi:MAG: methylornithine synthase PylB [Desulfobacterales bacterium]|nr:methylornithine synthase PylB [Desulfobacterales bacterium]